MAVREQLEDPDCKISDLATAYCVDRATIRKYLPPSRKRERAAALSLIGQTFGKWTVIARAARPDTVNDHHTYWECWCVCGVIAPVRGISLTRGSSTQCTDCHRARREADA